MIRRFKSESGDIYVGNVYSEVNNHICMNDYTVWYEGETSPFEPSNPLDSVGFTYKYELSL